MDPKNRSPFNFINYYIILAAICLVAAMLSLLQVEWYFIGILGIFALVIAVVLTIISVTNKKRRVPFPKKKMKKAHKLIKTTGDVTMVYKVIDKDILPALRKHLPKKIYKYYPLKNGDTDQEGKDSELRINSLKNQTIWASLCSGFNDPYEGKYIFFSEKDLSAIGFPKDTKKIGDSILEALRKCISIICFTLNPNDLPMWAHYANEHQGFCVEYEITDTSHFYPVCYTHERVSAPSLFVELFHALTTENAPLAEKELVMKHCLFLYSFKYEDWSSEHEVRAIFLNGTIDKNGKLYSYDEIGIIPTKLFIGVCCSEKHKKELIDIANKLNIPYELCTVRDEEKFSVLSSK